jgi:signal transduction histidine kinase
MSDPTPAARYLQALARVQSSQAHEIRAQLGSLTLQLGLVGEILKRSDSVDSETREKLQRYLGKADAATRELLQSLERLLTQTRSSGDAPGPLDLRQALREAEGVLAPLLKERHATCRLELPSLPVTVEGDRDGMRRALVVALLDAVETMPDGGACEIRLDEAGTLRCSVAPSPASLASFRDLFESQGGAARIAGDPPALEIRLPIQARAV